MSTDSTIRARLDDDIKHEAMNVLKGMGLTASDAIRMMMVKIARERRLPFSPYEPNKETVAAMEDSLSGKTEKFDSVTDFMKASFSED